VDFANKPRNTAVIGKIKIPVPKKIKKITHANFSQKKKSRERGSRETRIFFRISS